MERAGQEGDPAARGGAMPTALVTGASRGLGLELTRQLAAGGWRVVATARLPARANALRDLAARARSVDVLPLDVTDAASAEACAHRLAAAGTRLDLLVNNAGRWDAGGPASRGPLDALAPEALLAVVRTNTLGAVVVTRALAPRLTTSARIVNVSSGLGSLGRAVPRRNLGYALSKAGLNMVTRYLADELGPAGVTVVSVDPGWVRTDLGGPQARLSPAEAVAGLLGVLDRLGPDDNGAWLNRHGERVEW